MKKKWRLPRLSRRGKTVRNLALALLLAIPIWGQYGWPMPTAELEFRRQEHRLLLPRSEIIFYAPKQTNELEAGEGKELILYDPWVVGVSGNWAHVAMVDGRYKRLWTVPLEGTYRTIPLQSATTVTVDYGGGGLDMSGGGALLFMGLPEEAESTRSLLEVEAMWQGETVRQTCRGYDLGDGLWLFVMDAPANVYSNNWAQGAAYNLHLCGEDGTILPGQAGVIPQVME